MMKLIPQGRRIGIAGALGALALLGGCVATGPVGYDDYGNPYYGVPAQVDVDVYSAPVYRGYPGYAYPSYPYYYGRPGYDRRWDDRYRRPPPPRAVVPVPVPVPVPTPGVRPPRPGWQSPTTGPGVRPEPVIRGQRLPGLPQGTARGGRPVAPGDAP